MNEKKQCLNAALLFYQVAGLIISKLSTARLDIPQRLDFIICIADIAGQIPRLKAQPIGLFFIGRMKSGGH